MNQEQFKCWKCSKELDPGPQKVNVVEVSPAEFPEAAAWGHPLTYRLCRTCESQITPAGRAEIERILCVHLNLTLRLKDLGEAMRDHEFRTNPTSRKMADLAIQFHQGFRVDSSFWIGKTEAYIRAVEGAPAAAREVLGGDWLESMRRILEAERRALQKSHEVAAELLRRITPPAKEG